MADSSGGKSAELSALRGAAELSAANDREILKVLTQILEGARHREQELHETLQKVTASLDGMTDAFREQSEAVAKLLDLRNRVRDLETSLAEERRLNRDMRTKLQLIGKMAWQVGGPVLALIGVGVAWATFNNIPGAG